MHRIFNIRLSGDGEDNLEHSIRCGLSGSAERSVERHFSTSQYALVYLAEGSGSYRSAEGEVWALKEGSLFQRFPETSHTVTFSGGHRKYYLALPSQVFTLLEKAQHPFIRQPVHNPGTDRGIAGEYERLLGLYSSWDGADYFSLLVEMQQTLARIIKAAGTSGNSVEERLERGAELLRNDGQARFALEEIARRSGMGYHHFRKAFTRRYGKSPGQYRTEGRIQAAMGLLRSPDISVSQVAAELGYGDLYMFSAQFKKVTGQSPSRFRANLPEAY